MDMFHRIKADIIRDYTELEKRFGQYKKNKDDDKLVSGMEYLIDNIGEDLRSLKETVEIVSHNRTKFNMNNDELQNRREFISSMDRKVKNIQTELSKSRLTGYYPVPSSDNPNCELKMAYAEQDKYLLQIEETVDEIKTISTDMGSELEDQNSLFNGLMVKSKETSDNIRNVVKAVDNVVKDASTSSIFAAIAALSTTSAGLLALLILL